MNTNDQLSTRNPTIADKVRRWYHRLVRCLRFAFVRRLAVMPLPFTEQKDWPKQMRFEWQHMPVGYRWF